MKKLLKRRGGFTLIELMIVVAIIGILAALAIPNFLRFQLRAKASEGKTNLAAIRTAEEGYFAEFGTYVAAGLTPAALPGTAKVAWTIPAVGCPACFDTLGWSPEGNVFFQYQVVTAPAAAPFNEFFAYAVSDIDGDAALNEWGYAKGLPGVATTAMAPAGCAAAAAGAYNPVTAMNDLLETVGPCNATSGQSVF